MSKHLEGSPDYITEAERDAADWQRVEKADAGRDELKNHQKPMTNPNDQAYPTVTETSYVPGLTKREYFAAMAMQGFCSNPSWDDNSFDSMASAAVDYANAIIEALNKPVP